MDNIGHNAMITSGDFRFLIGIIIDKIDDNNYMIEFECLGKRSFYKYEFELINVLSSGKAVNKSNGNFEIKDVLYHRKGVYNELY